MYASLFGWANAFAWSIAYYPSIFLNWHVQSSDAISLDTALFNTLGYSCYAGSVVLQVFSDKVKDDYMSRYHTLPVLSASDLFYSIHGLFTVFLLLTQVVLANELWHFPSKSRRCPNRFTQFVFASFFVFLCYQLFYINRLHQLISFSLGLAYVKFIINSIKFIPQILHNIRRKSMHGFSSGQFLLDTFGIVMMLIEFVLKNDLPLPEAIMLNRGKLGLAVISATFNFIFFTQFIIYPSTKPIDEDTESAIPLHTLE